MNCPHDGAMPVCSTERAQELMSRLEGSQRDEVLWESLKWLVREEPDHWARVYTESGAEYDEWQKADIAMETADIAASPCPFLKDGGCLVCGDGPCYDPVMDSNKAPYGWLPLLFCLAGDRDQVKRLVQLGIVPDVKVVYLTRNTAFIKGHRNPDGSASVTVV